MIFLKKIILFNLRINEKIKQNLKKLTLNKKSLIIAIIHIFGLRSFDKRKFGENIISLIVCLFGSITFCQFIREKAILEISEKVKFLVFLHFYNY